MLTPARRASAEELRTRLGISRDTAEQQAALGALPEAASLAADQIEEALARSERDLSTAPRWTWAQLDRLTGPMLPGDLWIVGALMANGKTSFLLSQLDAWHGASVPVLYLPLEMDPPDLRRRWAAWRLGYNPIAVARNEWGQLEPGAKDRLAAMVVQLGGSPSVQFPGDKRVSLDKLRQWAAWGVREIGARVIVIDHLHRMQFAPDQYRIAVTEAMREIKDLAREHQVVVLAAAQLNQHTDDPLDRYFPPTLRRLKESAGIAEEADVVLMLSRRLTRPLGKQEMLEVRCGLASERDYAAPGVMAVTCRKHRLADAMAGDRTVTLHVRHGRVEDDDPGDAYEPQEG